MHFEHYFTNILERNIHLIHDHYKNKYYIYDPNTALFASIDKDTADIIIRGTDVYKNESVMETLLALLALEEKNLVSNIGISKETKNVLAISLALREDCNMSCSYCYNNNHYDKNECIKKVYKMDHNVALKAIFESIINMQESDTLAVQFIGGEPLLDYIGIKKIIERTEEFASKLNRKIKFSISTNGLLLDEVKAIYFVNHKVSIYVSIDGSKNQHNKHRKLKNGNDSFNIIKNNITRFYSIYDKPIRTCRVTASTKDFDFVEAVDSCLKLGFNNIATGIPFISILEAVPFHQREQTISEMIESVKNLRTYCLKKYAEGVFFRVGLLHGVMYLLHAYHPQFVACAATRRYIAVSANGNVVPCHRYIGTTDESKVIENIKTDDKHLKFLDIQTRNEFIKQNKLVSFEELEDCNSCWIRHLCGGLCYEVSEQLIKHSISKELLCKYRKSLINEILEMYIELQEIPEAFNYVMKMNANLRPNNEDELFLKNNSTGSVGNPEILFR